MNRNDKCEEILRQIITIINRDYDKDEEFYIKFMSDIGRGNSCTIQYFINENRNPTHSHFGGFSHNWNQLVDELYSFFVLNNK